MCAEELKLKLLITGLKNLYNKKKTNAHAYTLDRDKWSIIQMK